MHIPITSRLTFNCTLAPMTAIVSVTTVLGLLFSLSADVLSADSSQQATAIARFSEQHRVTSALSTLTAAELIKGLEKGELHSHAVTSGYLKRISELNRSGPALRAIIATNPKALAQASASDARRARGLSLGPLDGIPILIKDNIETSDPIATTAGSLALMHHVTGQDSPLVAALRKQGAVILGKTNLSQWANFRSSFSVSGWSSIGGQTKNPHVLDRSPCGSSSGSGVAVAAGLATLAIGTETNGSIICPANVNGVVGFKPTLGLISQKGIIPISPSQDTAGPMAKTVFGAALLMDGMVGASGQFTSHLTSTPRLPNTTVAVMRFSQGSHPAIIERFNTALGLLEEAGATLVEVHSFKLADPSLGANETLVLQTEFKATLNTYLSETPGMTHVRNLKQLIEFNDANAGQELALFGQDIFKAAQQRAGLNNEDYNRALRALKEATGSQGIDRLLAETGADVLVAPSGPIAPPRDSINGDVWPAWVGIGHMAAIAGYPHLSVPMGTVKDVPIGLSFISGKNQDATVLAIGHQWQQLFGGVPEPRYLPSAAL